MMSMERELTEYRALCASLGSLRENFIKKRQALLLLLEKTAERRLQALMLLAKANRLTRHLNGYQRQITGLSYHLGEIKTRIRAADSLVFMRKIEDVEILPGENLQGEFSPGEFSPETLLEAGPESLKRAELKRKGLVILGLIDRAKEKLLKLDFLELRCRELLLSINKALEAFRHEWKIIRKKIYPFGIFSLARRSWRRLLGNNYFFPRDLESISALGNMTGLVLKIADTKLA